MSFDFRRNSDLRHPAQRKMRERIQFVLSKIEEAGKEGMEEGDLLGQMFINGFGEPKLIKKYIAYLVDWGKIRKEGGRLYSSNYSVKGEQDSQTEPNDSLLHTHTHTTINGVQA